MCMLQLVMMQPFGVFYAPASGAPRTLDIYADDVTLQIMMAAKETFGTTRQMIAGLAVVLQALALPIASGKAKILSSAEDVARQVAEGVRQYGFITVNTVNVPGMECRAGAHLSFEVVNQKSARSKFGDRVFGS